MREEKGSQMRQSLLDESRKLSDQGSSGPSRLQNSLRAENEFDVEDDAEKNKDIISKLANIEKRFKTKRFYKED